MITDNEIAEEAKKRYPYDDSFNENRINKLSSKRRRFIEGAKWMKQLNQYKMEKSNYDNYAGLAMQALIGKSPLLDNTGEIGEKKTDEEMQEIKKELCRTAHAYAAWMMQTREEFVDYLKTIDIIV